MGRDDEQSSGQVSEVQKMDAEDAGTPISDDQSVNAQPDGESGEVQEGPAGPNPTTSTYPPPLLAVPAKGMPSASTALI